MPGQPAQPARGHRPGGDHQRQRARDQHRDAIAQHGQRRRRAARLRRRDVGAIGVEDDVLRGGGEGDEDRHGREQRERRPAATATPIATSPPTSASCVITSQPRRRPRKGGTIAVHERRPEEFPRVGQPHQREDADGREVDALDRHPRLQRAAGERERQARGEAEQEDDREVAVAKDGGVGRCHWR